ncbi:B-cell receptor CD22-like [Salvelinus alpinus]|uniref:B-cell receptor CD22-like n=1 Tax=Salvelinus alpinus TaxID=8036 RepID=UPI0039FBE95F
MYFTPDGPRNTSVSVSPSGEIVEGSSVTLTCSSDANPPVDKYTWYKKNGASLTGSENSFLITNINSEDSGEYYCEAESIYGSLNSSSVSVDVQCPPDGPKNTSVSVSPSGEIVEGSSVTLTCSSDANPPVDKYTWYFQNETFLNGFGQIYNISKFKSKDNGHYHCEAWNGRGSRNSTALMIILPGESVRPDCNSDTYTALNMRTTSPDYDTLASVHPDPNSDTYTPLNMRTRSPEYDTLAGVELESTRLVIRYPDRWMQRTPPSPQRTNPIGLNTSSAPQYTSTG